MERVITKTEEFYHQRLLGITQNLIDEARTSPNRVMTPIETQILVNKIADAQGRFLGTYPPKELLLEPIQYIVSEDELKQIVL